MRQSSQQQTMILIFAIRLLGPACLLSQSLGQEDVLPFQSSELDLRIPPNPTVRSATHSRVLVRSPSGEKQVAEVLCNVNDQVIVVRPSGELALVSASEAQPTQSELSKYSSDDVRNLLTAAGISGYKMSWQKPYLFVYSCSDQFYEYTKTIITSMYPGVVKQLMTWDLDPSRPKAPLIVVITPSRAAFDAIKRIPPEILAYYDVVSNLVVLYEDQQLADAAPELALKQAAYTIVHEAVHQLLYNTGVAKRLSNWPMWVTEGIPEYLSPLRVRSKVVRKKSAALPVRTVRWTEAGMVNDLRMYRLLKLKGGSGQLIQKTADAETLDAQGYAVAWGMVHHLATNRSEEFKAYLKQLSGLPPLRVRAAQPSADLNEPFSKHFGDDFAALERDVRKHLTSRTLMKKYRDPVANQTRYLVKRIHKKGKIYDVAGVLTASPTAAREWKEQQEKLFEKASFYTVVCETEQKAAYEWRKLKSVGR